MCVLSQNPTYIQYIFKYIKCIHTYIDRDVAVAEWLERQINKGSELSMTEDN